MIPRIQGRIRLLEEYLIGSVLEASRVNFTQGAQNRVAAPRDYLDVSGTYSDFLKVRQLVNSVPEVSHARFNEVRQKVQMGTYNVLGERIAARLTHSALLDAIL